MRARVVILVIAIVAVAGFAALNWAEFARTTPLNFGLMIEQASLPLILLGALGVALLAFLISSARGEHHRLVEYREHGKALQAQRDLADKAEASRFTDLRQHLDTQLRENREREGLAAAAFEKSVAANQRELRAQLEQINRTLASRPGVTEGTRNESPRAVLGADHRVMDDDRTDLRDDRANLREGRHDLRDESRGDGRLDPRPDAVRPGSRTTIL